MSDESEDDGREMCQRCGERDYDRRTLWMACFYAMNELPVPFTQVAIEGHFLEKTGSRPGLFSTELPTWSDPIGDASIYSFYTLRVCKRCRGEWMAAIKEWFRTVKPERESPLREYDCWLRVTGNTWRGETRGDETMTTKLDSQDVASTIREVVAGWTTAYDQGKVSAMIDLHDVAEVLLAIADKLDPDGQ